MGRSTSTRPTKRPRVAPRPDHIWRCNSCGENKQESEFYAQKRPCGSIDLHTYCKPCYGDMIRKSNWAKKYGITENQYHAMLEAQGGGCAICGTTSNQYGGEAERHFAVDHDHETNEVRGLLCQTCNRMIGLAQDSVEVLEKAVRYLS